MNLSGLGVRLLMKRRGCGLGDLVVVHDDLDLGLGRLKFKQRGGDGGHKGIRSIAEVLGDHRFLRLRIGVGRPPRGVDPTEYVLQPFGLEERGVIGEALDRAVDAVGTLMSEGLQKAMGRYHMRSET
jgi:PTH1 family peptidyl-tRNA hydrolase